MTFKEWIMKEDPDMGCSVHDCILDGDYKKHQDCMAILEEAFEAGWGSCHDHWGGMDYKETIKDGFMKDNF